MLEILRRLVACRSISPCDGGAIDCCAEFLQKLGFTCHVMQFGEIKNLYAKYGKGNRCLCFAGHVDVVPPFSEWNSDPFELVVSGDRVIGRGTNDMKGPLAAALKAISDTNLHDKAISVMLTSDEEIMGDYGTNAIVDFLLDKKEKITGCVLCESCAKEAAGEYVKIGCKGSLSVDVNSVGSQCHVAIARYSGNCVNNLIHFLNKLLPNLDDGNSNFEPSSAQVTYLNTPEIKSRNVVPNRATALLNIRFNDTWTFDSIENYIIEIAKQTHGIDIKFLRGQEAFIGSTDEWTNFLKRSITKAINKAPECGTYGGNSDAVFIRKLCPVAEIGAPIHNAHMSNEYITLSDLNKLYNIYRQIIDDFFAV